MGAADDDDDDDDDDGDMIYRPDQHGHSNRAKDSMRAVPDSFSPMHDVIQGNAPAAGRRFGDTRLAEPVASVSELQAPIAAELDFQSKINAWKGISNLKSKAAASSRSSMAPRDILREAMASEASEVERVLAEAAEETCDDFDPDLQRLELATARYEAARIVSKHQRELSPSHFTQHSVDSSEPTPSTGDGSRLTERIYKVVQAATKIAES
jgi:plasmid stability protein